MSLSDCEKCWDTPCSCGWEYRDDSKERRIMYAAAILGVKVDDLRQEFGKFVPNVHPKRETAGEKGSKAGAFLRSWYAKAKSKRINMVKLHNKDVHPPYIDDLVKIDTTGYKIFLLKPFNTGVDLYSHIKHIWKDDDHLIKWEFPFIHRNSDHDSKIEICMNFGWSIVNHSDMIINPDHGLIEGHRFVFS